MYENKFSFKSDKGKQEYWKFKSWTSYRVNCNTTGDSKEDTKPPLAVHYRFKRHDHYVSIEEVPVSAIDKPPASIKLNEVEMRQLKCLLNNPRLEEYKKLGKITSHKLPGFFSLSRSLPYPVLFNGGQVYIINPKKPVDHTGKLLAGNYSQIEYAHPIWLAEPVNQKKIGNKMLVIGSAEVIKFRPNNQISINLATVSNQINAKINLFGSKQITNIKSINKIVTVEPRARGIDLQSFLKHEISINQRLDAAIAVLEAYNNYRNVYKLAHLDLAPQNIIFDGHQATFIDRDFTEELGNNSNFNGHPYYMHPALLNARLHSPEKSFVNNQADEYSVGIILLEILQLVPKQKSGQGYCPGSAFEQYKGKIHDTKHQKTDQSTRFKDIVNEMHLQLSQIDYCGVHQAQDKDEVINFLKEMTRFEFNNAQHQIDNSKSKLSSMISFLKTLRATRDQSQEVLIKGLEKDLGKTDPQSAESQKILSLIIKYKKSDNFYKKNYYAISIHRELMHGIRKPAPRTSFFQRFFWSYHPMDKYKQQIHCYKEWQKKFDTLLFKKQGASPNTHLNRSV